MALLKDLFNPAAVRALGAAVKHAYPSFDEKAFARDAGRGLAALEMKARVRQLAAALRAHLPSDLSVTLPVLVAALRSEENLRGVDGFRAWPIAQFVEEYGLDDLADSLAALKEITKAMSAEFAVRPFLLRYPSETRAELVRWAADENVHVRRLASEGSRPRLPWGARLKEHQADPSLCLPILRALRADPELYVRKSVANHLNDISKDHPEWLVTELRRWREECPDDKQVLWIIRHALRSLVKTGHGETLALLGFAPAKWRGAKLRVAPATVKLGGSLKLEFAATAAAAGRWVIDYAVHFRKADGSLRPKVFKWTVRELRAGEKVSLAKSHPVKKITTRRYYPGAQAVEVFVNGKPAAKASFRLSGV